MGKYNVLDKHLAARGSIDRVYEQLTTGEVIDTNDPQQMGRVRVFCPLWDAHNQLIEEIPWATAVTPLAGVSAMGQRGPENSEFDGPVSYGMWNVPPIGSQVILTCLEGDPNLRIWLGCINAQYYPHTMPHGRYIHDKVEPNEAEELTEEEIDRLQATGEDELDGLPDGPLDTLGRKIEPLYENYTEKFTKSGIDMVPETPDKPRHNLEWRTRGADTQVAALTPDVLASVDTPGSKLADDFDYKFTEEDGNERYIFCQGYKLSSKEPQAQFSYTPGNKNYDSHTYSWTTPNLHAISMDDSDWNCRMRFRTTGGNEIVIDDTHERIHISTSEGKTWLELDQKGNIDVYATEEISFTSEKDINMYAGRRIRMQAVEGVHILSEDEIRVHAKKQLHIKSVEETYFETMGTYYGYHHDDYHVETEGDAMHYTHGDFESTSLQSTDIFATGKITLTSLRDVEVFATGKLQMTSIRDTEIFSVKKIQLTAVTDVELYSVKNIQLTSILDTEIFTTGDFGVTAAQDIDMVAIQSYKLQANLNINFTGVGSISLSAGVNISELAGGYVSIEGGGVTSLKGGTISLLAGAVLSTPFPVVGNSYVTPTIATPPSIVLPIAPAWPQFPSLPTDPSEFACESYVVSRLPEHEPWARVHGDPAAGDNCLDNFYFPLPKKYTDKTVGTTNRDGGSLNRNDNWHR